MEWQDVIDSLYKGRDNIQLLFDMDSEHEDTLTDALCTGLKWTQSNLKFNGLFGWNNFDPDGHITVGRSVFITEVKKVTKKSEYGYWHAGIQGLLYRHQMQLSGDFFLHQMPVLCVIFDWGRISGQNLEETERSFLNRFLPDQIFFLRLRMNGGVRMEHNLLEKKWHYI